MSNPECCNTEMKELFISVTDVEKDKTEDAFVGYECQVCKAQYAIDGDIIREGGATASDIWDNDQGWVRYCETCKHRISNNAKDKDFPIVCEHCKVEIVGVYRV